MERFTTEWPDPQAMERLTMQVRAGRIRSDPILSAPQPGSDNSKSLSSSI